MRLENIPFDTLTPPEQLSPKEKEIRERFKKFLERIRIRATDHYVFPPEILTVDEITVATVGNFSASVGKPKSRKTFNVSAIVAALLSSKVVLHYRAKMPKGKCKVLYIDTEQSRVHCHKVLHRILKMAGLPEDKEASNLEFLMLREFSPQQRRNIIDATLECDSEIGFVVIDGIRDLINDINSPSESVSIINDLMRWTNMYDIHIHTVLHLNKSDDNTRGHIGTELNNKAETVMKVAKSEINPNVSEVRPMITREKEFGSFAFRVNEHGLPEEVPDFTSDDDTKVTLESISEQQHKDALEAVFGGSTVKGYSPLLDKLREKYAEFGYERGRTSFSKFLKQLIVLNVIVRSGREYKYNPDNVNKLKN